LLFKAHDPLLVFVNIFLDIHKIRKKGRTFNPKFVADYNINSKKMEKIKCKLLIILGCNSGHYDYKKSNPAYCFAKRINGVVIASDGTVYSSRSYGELVFNSIADNHYLGYCKKQTRPNKGWLIYQYLNSDITVKETMYKQLQFKALIAYLKLIKKLKGI
ncbi:MAG: hypothetical protein Q4D76_19600, partial [Oscillospiraceae bacterium]|nr:hypothetical protein [Oscillospiraceae bacterium]